MPGRFGYCILTHIPLITSNNGTNNKKNLLVKQPAFGEQIWKLPLQTGITQEELAAYLGMTYGTVNRSENGCLSPSPIAMQLIQQKIDEMGETGVTLSDKYFSS